MTCIISLSGGLASGVSALIAHRHGLDFRLVFADTLIEDPDVYRFNADIARVTAHPLVHLTDGRTPWDVFLAKRWIGNNRLAHCSSVLKTEQVQAWIARECTPEDSLVLGMDWSEADRLERAQIRWQPRPVRSLLNEYKVTRPQYAAWLADYGLTPPSLYAAGFLHNNCGGFCVKAGLTQFVLLFDQFPERYAFHEAEEARVMAAIGPTAKPFLSRTVNGEREWFTLKEYREYLIEARKTPALWQWLFEGTDHGGCGCFTD